MSIRAQSPPNFHEVPETDVSALRIKGSAEKLKSDQAKPQHSETLNLLKHVAPSDTQYQKPAGFTRMGRD